MLRHPSARGPRAAGLVAKSSICAPAVLLEVASAAFLSLWPSCSAAVRTLPESPAPRVALLQARCLAGGGEVRAFLLHRPPFSLELTSTIPKEVFHETCQKAVAAAPCEAAESRVSGSARPWMGLIVVLSMSVSKTSFREALGRVA